MATASAAAMPAAPDIRTPDQLSGLSSIVSPALSAIPLRNRIKGWANPARSAKPLENEEIRFITISRGCLEADSRLKTRNRCHLVMGTRVVVQRVQPGFAGFIVTGECGRYSGGSRGIRRRIPVSI